MQLIFKMARFGGKVKNERKKRFDQRQLVMSEKDIKYNIVYDKSHEDIFYKNLSFDENIDAPRRSEPYALHSTTGHVVPQSVS